MTLDELQKRFPDATAETWHQHSDGGGWVENTATVAATAYVGPDAVVRDSAVVEGRAVIGDYAVVRDRAVIGVDTALTCGEWTESPLYIHGTHHSLNMDGDRLLRIGCILKPIAWWLENNVRCGEENGYTPEQIAEYRRYIELAAAMYGSGK